MATPDRNLIQAGCAYVLPRPVATRGNRARMAGGSLRIADAAKAQSSRAIHTGRHK